MPQRFRMLKDGIVDYINTHFGDSGDGISCLC